MGISPPIEVANLGMADSLILMVLALVVFGPRRLPQIGRQIGKLMYEFRKASNDFKFQMEEELRNAEDADRRKREEAERQRALTLVPPPQAAAAVAGTETTPPATVNHGETDLNGSENLRGYGNESNEPEDTESDAATAAESGAEKTPLQVRPPATGEPVPAARPGSVRPEAGTDGEPGAETSAETSSAPAGDSSPEREAAETESHAVTESTVHHG